MIYILQYYLIILLLQLLDIIVDEEVMKLHGMCQPTDGHEVESEGMLLIKGPRKYDRLEDERRFIFEILRRRRWLAREYI